MGEVWKVKERKTGKILALKTMLPQLNADEKAKRMFLREAKLSEFLRHRNVVRTYQTGCADCVFYILMDLCEGGSVDNLMKKHGGKLPLNLATYIRHGGGGADPQALRFYPGEAGAGHRPRAYRAAGETAPAVAGTLSGSRHV